MFKALDLQSMNSKFQILKKKKKIQILAYLQVCLFGGKIKWMENFEEKIERKTLLRYIQLGGEERK